MTTRKAGNTNLNHRGGGDIAAGLQKLYEGTSGTAGGAVGKIQVGLDTGKAISNKDLLQIAFNIANITEAEYNNDANFNGENIEHVKCVVYNFWKYALMISKNKPTSTVQSIWDEYVKNYATTFDGKETSDIHAGRILEKIRRANHLKQLIDGQKDNDAFKLNKSITTRAELQEFKKSVDGLRQLNWDSTSNLKDAREIIPEFVRFLDSIIDKVNEVKIEDGKKDDRHVNMFLMFLVSLADSSKRASSSAIEFASPFDRYHYYLTEALSNDTVFPSKISNAAMFEGHFRSLESDPASPLKSMIQEIIKDSKYDIESELDGFYGYLEGFIRFLKKEKAEPTSKSDIALKTDSFNSRVKSFAFDSKTDLRFLLQQQIQGFGSSRELVNSISLLDLIRENIKNANNLKGEERKSFEKFMEVLRQLASYAELNSLKLDSSDPKSQDYKEKKNKLIDDFIEFAYAQPGDEISENTLMRKSPEDPLAHQKRIWLDMLRGWFDERILINEEMQKNPTAAFQFNQEVDKLRKVSRAVKQAFKNVALDMTQLLAAFPQMDTTPEGWTIIYDIINNNFAKRNLPLKVQAKEKKAAAAVPKGQKGGSEQALALLDTYVDSYMKYVSDRIKEFEGKNEVLKVISDIMKKDPNNLEIGRNLVNMINGASDKNRKLFTQVTDLALKNPEIFKLLNAIFEKNFTDVQKGVEVAETFINLGPDEKETLLNLVPIKDHGAFVTTLKDFLTDADPNKVETKKKTVDAILKADLDKVKELVTHSNIQTANEFVKKDLTTANAVVTHRNLDTLNAMLAKENIDAANAVLADDKKDALTSLNALLTNNATIKAISDITTHASAINNVAQIDTDKQALLQSLIGIGDTGKIQAFMNFITAREFNTQFAQAERIVELAGKLSTDGRLDELLAKLGDADFVKKLNGLKDLYDVVEAQFATLKAYSDKVKEQADYITKVVPKVITATLYAGMYAKNQADALNSNNVLTKMHNLTEEINRNLLKGKSGGRIIEAHDIRRGIEEHDDFLSPSPSSTGGEAAEGSDHVAIGGAKEEVPAVPAVTASAPAAAEPSKLEKSKKNLADLDTAKKEIRSVLDIIGGIRAKYEKTFANLVKKSIVKKDQESYAEEQKQNKVEETYTDAKGNPIKEMTVIVTSKEQELAAKYKTLSEDGKAWIQELEKVSKDIKDKLQSILDQLTKIYGSDPTNKKFIDDALEVKMLFEGDYNASDETRMGLISHVGNLIGTIKSEYEDAERVYKTIATSVKERTDLQKEKIRARQTVITRGGVADPITGKEKDEAEEKNDDTVFVEINYITEKLDRLLKGKVNELDIIFRRATNPVLATAVSEPSLFSTLYNQYQDRRNKVGQFVAANELAKTMEANELIPRKALAVTGLDKTVFVFMTLFIRLFALSLVEWLIAKNQVRKMSWALGAFLVVYAAVFILFTLVVNMDIYRMRILFNYVNFHGNAGLVMTHLGMMLVFSIILFIVIQNVNLPIRGFEKKTISEEDKTSLMYRLEVLTMIIWLFLMILVVVI